MKWIDSCRTAIAKHLAEADRKDSQLVEADIEAQRHRAEAGRIYAAHRNQIVKECDRLGISEDEWCRTNLPPSLTTKEAPGLRTMQALMRLHKRWQSYERERRRLGMHGPWGFSGAMSVVATETEREAIARHNAIGNKRITAESYDPATDDYHTPRQWFDPLHERLGFTIDLAASKTAHLLPRYFTAKEDALRQSWAGEHGYLNPPWVHRQIGKWLEYAFTQNFELLLACLPGEINAQWFHRFVWPKATALLVPDQRLQFGKANHSPWSVVFVLFASRAPWAVDAVADLPGFRLVRLSHATEEFRLQDRRDESRSVVHGSTNHRREPVPTAPAIHVTAKPPPPPRYWLTQPARWEQLRVEYPGIVDLYPYPFSGKDAFALKRWPQVCYLNIPFRSEDDPFGRSVRDHAREAIRRHQEEGCTIVLAGPSYDYVNVLFAAGAEGRSLGRERWLDAETGEPCPNPSSSSLFILRGRG